MSSMLDALGNTVSPRVRGCWMQFAHLGEQLLAADRRLLDQCVDRGVDATTARIAHGVLDEQKRLGLRTASEQLADDRYALFGRRCRIAERQLQLTVGRHRAPEPEQLVLDGVDAAGLLGPGFDRPDERLMERWVR